MPPSAGMSGIRPINWMPSSVRSILTEKSGACTADAGVTSNWSRMRELSISEPTMLTARKRIASFGAVPVSTTCSPSVSTLIHSMLASASRAETTLPVRDSITSAAA